MASAACSPSCLSRRTRRSAAVIAAPAFMCIPGMELDGVTDGVVEVASAPATSSPEAATATIAEMVVRVNDMWMTPRVVRTLTPRFGPRGGSVRSLVYGRAGGALGTGRGREHERRGRRKLGEAVERHPLA